MTVQRTQKVNINVKRASKKQIIMNQPVKENVPVNDLVTPITTQPSAITNEPVVVSNNNAAYLLENIDITSIFTKTNSSLALSMVETTLCKRFFTHKVNFNTPYSSVYDIICDLDFPSNFLEHNNMFADPVKNKEIMTSSLALHNRILRFRTKYSVIQVIAKCSPVPAIGIQYKLDRFKQQLEKRRIYIDTKNTTMLITVESTFKILVKELASAEPLLKDLLIGIYSTYCGAFPQYPIGELSPEVSNLLREVAPPGLSGVETDTDYIIKLLLEGPNILNMSNAQRKQWEGLAHELKTLLSFLHIGFYAERPDVSIYLREATRYINVPLKTFFNPAMPISNNGYSRLILAASHFILLTYTAVLNHSVNLKSMSVVK